MLLVVDQADFMTALAGDPKHWNVCASFFTCGGPMANEDGSQILTGPRDFAEAKLLIAEAGYKGEKITVLDSVELNNSHIPALIIADLLKRLGLNVELVSADWSAISARRASKKPPDEGGWSVFGTAWVGIDTLDPSVNVMLQANGDAAWFGWPKDDTIEALRARWIKAETFGERRELAAAIQRRAFETVPCPLSAIGCPSPHGPALGARVDAADVVEFGGVGLARPANRAVERKASEAAGTGHILGHNRRDLAGIG